jgi:hypothetical protein
MAPRLYDISYHRRVRVLVLGVVLAAAILVAWQSIEFHWPGARPSLPPRPTASRATARQIEDCRDACEQRQVVGGREDDAELRACRARCEGQAQPGPHEVPSRITVAPSLAQPKVYSPPAKLPPAAQH